MRSSKSGQESQHRRVLHRLQFVNLVEHSAHAVPLAWHDAYRAHFADALSACEALFSLTVLCAFTSLVTVDGLTSILLAMALAESPLRTPDSIASLFSLLRCFPFSLVMVHPLSARRGKRAMRL